MKEMLVLPIAGFLCILGFVIGIYLAQSSDKLIIKFKNKIIVRRLKDGNKIKKN